MEPLVDPVTGEVIEGGGYIASDGHVYSEETLRGLAASGDTRSPLTREFLRPIAYALDPRSPPLTLFDASVTPAPTLQLRLVLDTLPNDDAALFMAGVLAAAGAQQHACTLSLPLDGPRVLAPPLAGGEAHAARCAALCRALRIAHLAPENPGDIAAGCRVIEARCASLEDLVLRTPLGDNPLERLVARGGDA